MKRGDSFDYELDLSNWELFCARAISDDGSTIVGWGTHKSDTQAWTEAWIATIP